MLQGLPGHQGNAIVQAVNGIAWGATAVALLLSCEAQELGAAREPGLPEPESPQGVWLGGGTSGGYPHAGALTWAVCLELAKKQPSQVRSGAWLRRVAGGNGLETQCAAGKGARHKALTDR